MTHFQILKDEVHELGLNIVLRNDDNLGYFIHIYKDRGSKLKTLTMNYGEYDIIVMGALATILWYKENNSEF